MRRPYALTLTVISLPGGSLGGGKARHFAGLGDGNVDNHAADSNQGLRGAGTKRKRNRGMVRGRQDDLQVSPFLRNDEQTPRRDFRHVGDKMEDVLDVDDIDVMDYLRKTGGRRAAAAQRGEPMRVDEPPAQSPITTDGPWQLSLVMLLGIMAVLVGFFVHFSTDPASQYNFRRRMKKKHYSHSPSYKKKTDEWSEDEEVTEDDNYRGDTEGTPVGKSRSVTKKRSHMPKAPDDPTATLYYQLNAADSFRQQESRLRKSTTTQQQQQSSTNVTAMTGGSRGRPESTVPTFHSPSRQSRSTISSGNSARIKADKASTSPFPAPPFRNMDSSGVGSGLEGFSAATSEADPVDEGPAVGARPIVKPMGTFTPTESFASISSATGEKISSGAGAKIGSDESAEKTSRESPGNAGDFDTPPMSTEPRSGEREKKDSDFLRSPPFSPPFSPRRSGNYGGSGGYSQKQLSELPTPRVDHTKGKRDLARTLREKRVGGMPPLSAAGSDAGDDAAKRPADVIVGRPAAEYSGEKMAMPKAEANKKLMGLKPPDLSDQFPGLPLVPNLSMEGSGGTDGDNRSSFVDAPRSVLLEELQLVRMESGVSGPRWRTKYDVDRTAQNDDNDNDARAAAGVGPRIISEETRRQESENMEKLREASAAVDPADDPRNSIQHIRKDLTTSSDASSSLSSRIAFSELRLEDVVGGGGFGQVWRARWKGTPVAVKVLTGSAQAETVPRAVLEEFIAEINMVSGMRHPNICLFMGACLDPPNRAIVTELCENGSLWDALRSPLTVYEAADGMTREAWPLELYEPTTAPPPTFRDGRQVFGTAFEPPLAPAGAWPWALVKRVASGTARGMCYLHSGTPPVLHRDLKSANILLDESYTAKLADFGLSRLKAVRSGMTGNCGTVQWMAPEVLCNENYAEPADVFSFGIILWEMLTKECPYDGMTPIQCALSVLNENRRPEVPDWCPGPLRALIGNCLERDPRARPTFSQILAALDSLPP